MKLTVIVLFTLSILVLIKADFGDRITKNDDKTDQVKEESKEKEVKVKIIEKPNTTKKPTDKLLKNDEEVVKKQEPVDLISSQQNVKVNHVNPHQGNHPNNNQIHPSNNQIHSNGFERRRIYEFTYSKTQNDHPKPDDKEINHKVGLQSSPQESQQQHQKAPPHQQQAPPHQQQASLHQQQPNSEDPFLTFAKLVHSSFFPHASPSNHRLPEVRVPPVPQPPPQPKQPNISPPDFQFNEPFFHSQPAHHRQVHHKPEPLHRQPNHQQVITHKSNVQPIHQNHPPNQQNVIPHSNQQYPFKIPPGFPRPEHNPRAQIKREYMGSHNTQGKPYGQKVSYVYRDPKNPNNFMEVSEVQMTMNRQMDPNQAASEVRKFIHQAQVGNYGPYGPQQADQSEEIANYSPDIIPFGFQEPKFPDF